MTLYSGGFNLNLPDTQVQSPQNLKNKHIFNLQLPTDKEYIKQNLGSKSTRQFPRQFATEQTQGPAQSQMITEASLPYRGNNHFRKRKQYYMSTVSLPKLQDQI